MESATEAPTAECQHCGKDIRRNSKGIWGARKRDDPHPWYCDASTDTEKRHEPAGGPHTVVQPAGGQPRRMVSWLILTAPGAPPADPTL